MGWTFQDPELRMVSIEVIQITMYTQLTELLLERSDVSMQLKNMLKQVKLARKLDVQFSMHPVLSIVYYK